MSSGEGPHRKEPDQRKYSTRDLRNQESGHGRRPGTGRRRNPKKPAPKFEGTDFTAAQLASRAAALPVVTYPDLPVSRQRDQIAEAIKSHQVVIVAGETGSGKTTQLPKICLELGRGIAGMIGHTQPRRIAARAVAERIAEELGGHVGRKPGDIVGYQVRFTDEIGPTTLVKLMTDGILLAELGVDPLLRQYDTIIVDEAHERSLNIDFILGYLGTLLPKRPDLKVIITSATIDSVRFAEHFSGLNGEPVPVIEVSGRAYPVEVRYRPLAADLDSADLGRPDLDEDILEPNAASLDQDHFSPASRGTQLHAEQNAGELAVYGYGLGEDLDLDTALCAAVDELLEEPDGDILVFLPGERDIREAERTLAGHLGTRYVRDRRDPHGANGVEIVPLYARLSAAEQHRIYEPHSLRRVVLATNIAETSLTVPQIRYVIDAGLARISRFSNKTKVQRLPIERISQASAAQRAGRAGRTSPGIAIRLYSERDHLAKPDFTEPEILRTSLASVILQMSALGLGDIVDFPFLDAPSTRAVKDGIQLLVEIGALREVAESTRSASVSEAPTITPMGRKLARLPIDPRLGRMLIEADRLGCASEVLIIVAALSIQDVRERPVDHQEQSDQAHARFADRSSDFITYLNMWRYLSTMSRDLSGNAFRRMCKAEFFHYLRFHEWRDIVTQIRQMCRQLDMKVEPLGLPSPRLITSMRDEPHPVVAAVIEYGESSRSVSPDEVHRAILPGLLSNFGNWDEVKRNYHGPRGTRFTIWPGSGLRRRVPAWVMAAELVETSRLFARTVAGIKPEWIEEAGKHLVKRSYSEPAWSRSRGAATVKERVLLYGLTLAADRQVPLTSLGQTRIGRTYLGAEVEVNAQTLAREMFISHALVEGEWRDNHHAFIKHNREVVEEAEALADRLRDPSVVPDESVRYHFYNERVPQSVTSAAAFNRWWKAERTINPQLLDFSLTELLPADALRDPEGFPEVWSQGDLELDVSYAFTPGQDEDGVTITIPLRALQRVRDRGFDWLVPGLLEDLCVAMIRGLPKAKRRLLAPATDTGRIVADRLHDPQKYTNEEFLGRGSEPFGRAGTAGAPTDDGPEVDPYSLEASMARLLDWGGQTGTVQARKGTSKAKFGHASDSDSKNATDTHRQTANAESTDLGLTRSDSPSVAPSGKGPGPFAPMFARAVRNARGIDLTPDDLAVAEQNLPSHLRVGFRVVNDRGAIIGADDSLTRLQSRFQKQADSAVQKAVRGALRGALKDAERQEAAKTPKPTNSGPKPPPLPSAPDVEAQDIDEFPEGPLPGKIEYVDGSGLTVRGYPALVVRPAQSGPRVDVAIHASSDEALRDHREGIAMLLLKDLHLETMRVTTRWSGREALLLATSPYPNTESLVADAQLAAMRDLVDEALRDSGVDSIRDRKSYETLRTTIRDKFEDRVYDILSTVVRSAEAYAKVQDAVSSHSHPSLKRTRNAAKSHADGLFRDGYLTGLGMEIRSNLPRYLQADARRIEVAARGIEELNADNYRTKVFREVQDAFEEARERTAARPYSLPVARNLAEIEVMLEELRISLFAQALGTQRRVSNVRVLKRIDALEREL